MKVLIAGTWRDAEAGGTFRATNPRTKAALPGEYPVSTWAAIDGMLDVASDCAEELRGIEDVGEHAATFLNAYASALEADADALVAAAAEETGLAPTPRLRDVELPRTFNQLRAAASVARDGSWRRPIIDAKHNLRSCLAPIGPVWCVGPNNFPFAYNGVAGGDFAAAIATGNPVIAKAHPLHPTTSRLLAEHAQRALRSSGLPKNAVQFFYHVAPDDGLRLAADPRLAAVAFTGSRAGGLKLKAAADAAGRLFFGEMSSLNPVVVLPGALAEDAAGIVDQLAASVTMGAGQFCTKPGLVFLLAGDATERFVSALAARFAALPAGVLLGEGVETALYASLATLQDDGAEIVVGGAAHGNGYGVTNTLLRTSASQVLSNAEFLQEGDPLQTEAFGNATLLVVAQNLSQLLEVLFHLDGQLTGSIYSAQSGIDDDAYRDVAELLRPKVGRLLNDAMPTGVAVSPAMNHGGPWPATSQPHFTAVGLPAAALRFTRLECYDRVRPHRLPRWLRDA